VGKLRDALRRVAAVPARPFAGYFNRRFEDVHGHLDNETASMRAELDAAVATTRALQDRVATDVEVVSELAIGFERLAERFADRMDAVVAGLERLLGPGAPAPRLPEDATIYLAASRDHGQEEIGELLDRLRGGVGRDAEIVLSLPAPMVTEELLRQWEVLERHELDDGEAVALLRVTPRD
jgi:hypothetical protein